MALFLTSAVANAGRSRHEVGVNVSLSVSESCRNDRMSTPNVSYLKLFNHPDHKLLVAAQGHNIIKKIAQKIIIT